ncbi:AraC family ligand binding domain-containing protein [Paenibacillus glycanilyticus]|uniref:AraC family ligand binding domain-containing protein n=1 Tax=Paenibacillus glycanilyticus TaxID=126569 RepID=UPI00203D669D|nr:AraC family ligand binding domain-containing protein [Paenibacillus glycanilyticus]MCM3627813.1 AraC family ligand binding domain-containing protein [Paenibacillus glycanilyticus]
MKAIDVHWSEYSKHEEPFHDYYGNGLDNYIIRLQVEGVCQALVDGSVRDIRPGDLLLFKPGDLYDLRIGFDEDSSLSLDYYIIGDGPGLQEWWARKKRPALARIASDKRMKAFWHQIVLEKRRLDGGSPDIMTSLVWSLLLLIDRAIEEVPENQSPLAYHALRMRQYIEEHVTEALTLQQVAQHTGLSVSRAVHLFKAHLAYPSSGMRSSCG